MAWAIETQELTKRFGNKAAVSELNLRIPAGEIFGLLGPNGSGKTTTLRLLLGLIGPTAGTAHVLGYSVQTQAKEIRSRAGALLEHDGLYERFSACDNLDYYGRIYHLPEAERKGRIDHLLHEIGLWDRRAEPVSKWSKGMRQRLAIARSLMHDPQIAFFDEPTTGLDPPAAREVREAIRVAVAEHDRTYFICTNRLDEAERLCSLVAVINQGRLVACDAPSRLSQAAGQPKVAVSCHNLSSGHVSQVAALPFVRTAELQDGVLCVDLEDINQTSELVRVLVNAGVAVDEVRRSEKTLEEAFLALVREG